MYLTPLEQWMRTVFAPAGHMHAAGGGDAAFC